MRSFAALFFSTFAITGLAGEVLKYEPEVVQITGTIAKGKHEHPNGTWFDFTVIKLKEPASIRDDGQKDSFNEAEDNITEIQVSSADSAILKKMGALNGKKATLTGTLFHSHTAWHVRELVLMVTSVK